MDEPIYCVGVSKTWHNRGDMRHPRGKKVLFGYFVTESGRFFTRKVNMLEAIGLRRTIRRYRRMVCIHCMSKFKTLQPKDHLLGKRACPVCNR